MRERGRREYIETCEMEKVIPGRALQQSEREEGRIGIGIETRRCYFKLYKKELLNFVQFKENNDNYMGSVARMIMEYKNI